MKIEDFKRLIKLMEEEVKITDDNLLERSYRYPDTYMRYLAIFTNQLTELKSLEVRKKEMYGKLFKYYKYEDDRNWETKQEIESQIYSDKKYVDICVQYNEQEAMVKHL